MDILLRQFIPYKTISFLTNYLMMVNQIGEPNYFSNVWKKFRWFVYLIFLESIHLIWLYLFPRKNISEQYYNFDIISISEVPKEINLMIIGVLLYSGHYIYFMYFCEYKKLNQILFRILVSQNTFGIFRFPRMNSKRLVWQDIQFALVAILSFLQCFIFVAGKII